MRGRGTLRAGGSARMSDSERSKKVRPAIRRGRLCTEAVVAVIEVDHIEQCNRHHRVCRQHFLVFFVRVGLVELTSRGCSCTRHRPDGTWVRCYVPWSDTLGVPSRLVRNMSWLVFVWTYQRATFVLDRWVQFSGVTFSRFEWAKEMDAMCIVLVKNGVFERMTSVHGMLWSSLWWLRSSRPKVL